MKVFYILDSDYNNDTVMSSVLPNDRKHRRLVAIANELVKIASKGSGFTLKEPILLSHDKVVIHLNTVTTKEDIRMMVEVLNELK